MKLQSITLNNFRCFEQLELELDGASAVLVGPNGSGKTSLLDAIRLALRGGEISRDDFLDPEDSIELIATLTEIPASSHGLFAEAIDFDSTPPVLRLGFQALWDEAEHELQTTHAFPDKGWKRVSRKARDSIPLIDLPSWRDPARLLSLVGRRSILAALIDELPLRDDLDQAIAAITTTAQLLADTEELKGLLHEARDELARILPGVAEEAFALGPYSTEDSDVLRQLRLLLAVEGARTPLGSQSGGIGQASIFAFLLRRISATQAIVLIDEPENALHPQAQRALVSALRSGPSQSLLTTHSAAVLDRRDPREIARLARSTTGTDLHRAGGLSDADARSLSRYSTALSAEAFFAQTAILVEGYSDLLAVRVIAETLEIDLDARGVSLLSLDGAGSFKHYLSLFGPGGLELDLRGLCDADSEQNWQDRLQDAGIPATDRASMNAAGFQVADADLEAELSDGLGAERVAELIGEGGAADSLTAFTERPEVAALSSAEAQRAYLQKDKVRWAPVLAADLSAEQIPQPIRDLLEEL